MHMCEARQKHKDDILEDVSTLHARAGKMHKQSTTAFTIERLDEGIEEADRVAQHRAGVRRSPNLQVR